MLQKPASVPPVYGTYRRDSGPRPKMGHEEGHAPVVSHSNIGNATQRKS